MKKSKGGARKSKGGGGAVVRGRDARRAQQAERKTWNATRVAGFVQNAIVGGVAFFGGGFSQSSENLRNLRKFERTQINIVTEKV